MKSNQGIITDKEMAARRRFWNKKGFFGEPTKKQLERDSMEMQKLVKALKTLSSLEEVKKVRATKHIGEFFTENMCTVWRARESDINHAISTFKIY